MGEVAHMLSHEMASVILKWLIMLYRAHCGRLLLASLEGFALYVEVIRLGRFQAAEENLI